MKQYPQIPPVSEAPDEMFESGHLWILEKIDGAQLRFQLRESGVIRFGDRDRVYDDPSAIPTPLEHAVRHVRERLDREALRNAVDHVESVVFFGVATHHQTIEYDWDRLPSFLGFDVYSADPDAFRPPGAVQGIFERLGLEPINAVERERNTRDFDPDSYEIPDSNWYDGPAAGVVIRNKRGGRAQLLHPAFLHADSPVPVDASADELAEEHVTADRLGTLERTLEDRGVAVSVDALFDRVVTDVVREHHGRLFHDSSSVDMTALRSAVAAQVRAYLREE